MSYEFLHEITAEKISAAGVQSDEAERLHCGLAAIIGQHGSTGPAAWKAVSKLLLNPKLPFVFHQMMYYGCYKGFGSATPLAWIPELENAESTNIGQVLKKQGEAFLGSKYKDPISSFKDFQEFSVSNPEVYWKLIFEEMGISFFEPPSDILREDVHYPGGQWLPGACINAAANCLHENDKKGLNDVVLIWRDEGCDSLPVRSMTLKELRVEVWLVAHALDILGLEKGSSIAIAMPMTVTAVVVYLAIVLAGYVVVSIADSFASTEISTRLKISKAQAIFTQDYVLRASKELPLYSKVIDADAPLAIVIPAKASTISSRLRTYDKSWHDFLETAKHYKGNEYSAVKVPVEAFSNILFSSGTTGEPKAIPWTHATPLKAAADAWSHMDIRKGDVVAWPTNLGWMMGPWLVYATLVNGSAMAFIQWLPCWFWICKVCSGCKSYNAWCGS
ncbi:hypothetical protein HPP92_015014 [Vanilla planifolia]|uniref:4-coumarate--CoA ligase n=1 Tax=Vanilla planifolia TaxID=51239 RepID=A0A835UVD2_VANPL|nr:hypothetical protein HPP92_015014 [Vanilla planifolia]